LRAKRLAYGVVVGLLAATVLVVRPDIGAAQQGQAPAPAATQLLSKPELDQLVAPIALYPDPLLSQVLMGSTYPLEIVEAATRWADGHKGVSGAALTQALTGEPWDESVKALVATPSVLDMMSQKLEWTQSLGNAVIAQQTDVMAAVQRLRQQAQNHGSLKTTPQQTVTVDSSQAAPVIEIMPAQPDVIYVPYYEPAVVYGAWLYPAYPPYLFPAPVGYIAGPGLWFGAGVALGFGWDHWGNWGRFNWHGGNICVHGDVNAHWQVDYNHRVDVDSHSNVNVNVKDNTNVNVDDHNNADVNRQDDRNVEHDDNFDRGDAGFDRGDGGFDRGEGGFDRGGFGGFDRGGGGGRR
jgi:Protein of unknown function (DUF3300)